MEIGKKLKKIRNEKLLTQYELATRCELSKGFISQLEHDLTSPSIATLIDILEVLGTNLKEFFNEEQEENISFEKKDFYEIEDVENGYKIDWIVPDAQKNSMEPILMTIKSNGNSKKEMAHDGEEFGYILSGSIVLYYGKLKRKIKKGETFYFVSKEEHYITNPNLKEAKILWISTPPTF